MRKAMVGPMTRHTQGPVSDILFYVSSLITG